MNEFTEDGLNGRRQCAAASRDAPTRVGDALISLPSDPTPRRYDGLQCSPQPTPTEMLAPVYRFHLPSKRLLHNRLCV